ncbi:MAG: hypothetical protein Q3999_05610 [Buchananella hordeovulneris]|nr:hypothetical protein [Buchananella hordeovulneris]
MSPQYPSPVLPLGLRYTGRALAVFTLFFVGIFALLGFINGLVGDGFAAWIPFLLALVCAFFPVRLWANTVRPIPPAPGTQTAAGVASVSTSYSGTSYTESGDVDGEVIEAIQIDAAQVAVINAEADRREAEEPLRQAKEYRRQQAERQKRVAESAILSLLTLLVIPAASLGALITFFVLVF